MNRPDVVVHSFLANLTTRQYGQHPTSDLLGVDYWYTVPPDTEFPRYLGRMDLFTRFYLQGATPTKFAVRVWWLDAYGGNPIRVGKYGPFLVDFRPDEVVRDNVFRIVHVHLPGVGRYAVRLLRRRGRSWRASRWAILAETHFAVER